MYYIYICIYRCMFVNVFWTQQHIPLPLRMCASPNRATSSMEGSSWCRLPHKPSHTSCTKQHNRSYSCSDHICHITSTAVTWTWVTKASTRAQSTSIAVLLRRCAAKAIGKWSCPTPGGGAVCAHTVVLLVCVTHERVYSAVDTTDCHCQSAMS